MKIITFDQLTKHLEKEKVEGLNRITSSRLVAREIK